MMPATPIIRFRDIVPRSGLRRREIVDQAPKARGIEEKSRLLRSVRHNRLVDRLLDVSARCVGRIELVNLSDAINALYVGLDSKGIRCIIPVVALKRGQPITKSRYDKLSRYCRRFFPDFNFYPVFIQFLDDDSADAIALIALYKTEGRIRVLAECHYEIVDLQDLIDPEEWQYANSNEGDSNSGSTGIS